MRRREFITLIGGATAWPLASGAQQRTMPLVGFLNAQTAAGYAHIVAAFKQGLNESGFVDGQNVTIEYRWADGHVERLPELAADLVRLQPAVLVGTGGANAAAMAATKTIPVVASFGGDPVKLGYVASLNHPGGNVTGVTIFSPDLEAKRLELMNEILPRGATIGYLYDPNFDFAVAGRRNVETAARTVGREVRIVEATKDADLEKAFATLAEAHAGH
jgi:putative ABC transport system substrate-binding protein